jgi:hypothetical protein
MPFRPALRFQGKLIEHPNRRSAGSSLSLLFFILSYLSIWTSSNSIAPFRALPIPFRCWLAKRHMPPRSFSSSPRSLTHADHGHAYTDKDIDLDRIWNSVVDAATGTGTEEASEEEDKEGEVVVKVEKDIKDGLSASPNQ